MSPLARDAGGPTGVEILLSRYPAQTPPGRRSALLLLGSAVQPSARALYLCGSAASADQRAPADIPLSHAADTGETAAVAANNAPASSNRTVDLRRDGAAGMG